LLKADAGTVSVNGFDVATQPAGVRESISLTAKISSTNLVTPRLEAKSPESAFKPIICFG
jgi:ABC-type Na+ transport system ATPase subunit NatA